MPKLPALQSELLSALPHVQHGFFTRQGGVSNGDYDSLNCGVGSNDEPEKIAENRKRIAAHFSPATQLAAAHQSHSTRVGQGNPDQPFDGDGIFTQGSNIALTILTADCAPLLLADKSKPIVCAVHAGWRGAVAGITDKALAEMRKGGATDIVAAIGPHIGCAAYEVQADMRDACLDADSTSADFFTPRTAPGKWSFNLGGYLQNRLEQQAVQVDRLAPCTQSQPTKFFSYRTSQQQKQADYGRQASAILLR